MEGKMILRLPCPLKESKPPSFFTGLCEAAYVSFPLPFT